MSGLYFLKVTLRSGATTELAYETPGAVQVAWTKMAPGLAGDRATVTDDFGHVFSARADDVVACALVDMGAEITMQLRLAEMRQAAQDQFNAQVQQRQMARGKLLVPAGPVPQGPALNGAHRLG